MLRIYNTLTRKKEVLKPRSGKKVNLFVCGPTVYDYSHIGHARTYIFFDVFVKTLRKFGYKVFYLQNITDIDDKIIDRAKKDAKTFRAVAREYEKAYRTDMKALGVSAVDRYARATDFIPEIIGQIERLFRRGYAYQIEDGIYFNIAKFKRYGKLSGRSVEQAEDAISRIDESIKKINKGDFCLWKFSKPGEPKWKSPWGWGRPGWHIEDTAISESFFGPQYDLHGGGVDLMFPHHECEIAQQEAASGKRPFVKYWLHTGHLKVRGEKMAKSLKNFISIREMLGRAPKEVFRLFVLSAHWRSPLDYTDGVLEQAKSAHERLYDFKTRIKNAVRGKPRTIASGELRGKLAKTITAFYDNLEDDLNAPAAIAQIFNIIHLLNPPLEKGELARETAELTLRFLEDADTLLGIIGDAPKREVSLELEQLIVKREEFRRDKKWHAADSIRRKIEKAGWVVEDTATGARLRRK